MAPKKKKATVKEKHAKRKDKNAGTASSPGAFRRLIRWGFVAALWGVIALGIVVAWYAAELPDITEQMIFERRPTITIKANDGTIIDRYGDIKGEAVKVEELPQHVVYAILATEDRRFYYHFGIDPIGILRAFGVNVLRGGFVQGGSTITQQLAKNLFLSRERTLKRKVQEAMLAVWLETKLTKDEILSAYLNRVYLGSGAYGIDAAARVYFNKSAKELTLREAATIAGLLKAPARYSPASNPELSAERTQTVLASMVDAGFIEQSALDSLKKLPPSPRRKPSSGDTIRYFTDYIVGQLEDLIGTVDQDIVVQTTLDPDIQKAAEQAVTKGLLKYGSSHRVTQGAAVVMRLDGGIVGMVGGRDYGMSEYNRATNALRSPGSSFKPVIYLAALEAGWTPDTIIVDEPRSYGRYTPQNYGNEYYGEVTLAEALGRSLNTVAVQLLYAVGPQAGVEVARRLGVTADLEPNLSLALGSNGVPIIQMATINASLGRGGIAVEPFSILKVTNQDNKVLYERPKHHTVRQVVSRGKVYELTTMMRGVVEWGTGAAARGPYIAAGKTGTSQDFRDAWFNGFTDRYAAAVWFGNDDNSPMRGGTTGGLISAPAWREIMTVATAKPAPAYGTTSTVVEDFSFHDLIGNLLGSELPEGQTEAPYGEPIVNQNFNKSNTIEIAPGVKIETQEQTPRGRNKWQFND